MIRRFRCSALAALVAAILLFATAHAAGVLQAHDPAHSDTHVDICAALITDTTQTSLRSDCEVLLDIKETLRGTASLNWGDSGVAFASWDGITTSGTGASARVSRLQLRNLGLSGTIPARLGELTGLTWLLLDRNDLTGSIPSQLGSLTRLDYLYLYDNQLTGPIPSQLGSLTRLFYLYLYDNQLTGPIPEEMFESGNLRSLTRLYLANNQLSGEIPATIGNLSALVELHLGGNQLKGTIPEELANLAFLTTVNLSYNQLSGNIPTVLADMSYLQSLRLSNNQLTGPLPDLFTPRHAEPITLDLSDNKFTGPIPVSWFTSTSLRFDLEYLDLSHNQLSGTIPVMLFRTTTAHHFEHLDLSHNQLSGTIPNPNDIPGFDFDTPAGHFSNSVVFVDLGNNQLSGPIPATLVGYHNLTHFNVSHNQLSGSIPTALSQRTALEKLYLHDNRLSGQLPDLSGLDSLIELALGGNDLELSWSTFESGGMLPLDAAAPATRSLQQLYLHDSGLEGSIPDWIGDRHTNLLWLWLHNNRLTGSIPSNFSRLTRLVDLRLHGNMLTGGFDVLDGLTLRFFSRDTSPGVATFRTGGNSYAVKIAPLEGGAQPKVTLSAVIPEDARAHLPPHPSISSVVKIVSAVDIEVVGDFTPPAVVCVPVPSSATQGLEDDQEIVLLHEFQDEVWRVLEPADPLSGYDPGAGNIAVCGMTDSFSLFGVAVVERVSGGTGAIERISRIEPSIRSVTLSPGEKVQLGFSIYGRQDILNNDLGEGHEFQWNDWGAGGAFGTTGRANTIIYTAPERSGAHTVTATSPTGACLGGEDEDEVADRCTAKFTITVRRPSAATEERPAPKNPVGEIPSVLVDGEGRQYEVLTPEEGGRFDGESVTLSADPGVVQNLEIVGVRIDAAGPASNIGKAHHRYSLAGRWHEVRAVDAAGAAVSGYHLQQPLEVCLPLPPQLRSNVSDVAMVSSNVGDALTVHAAWVRLDATSTSVCANLGALPVTVAVGRLGSPADLPTPTPHPDDIEEPDTGGVAPGGKLLLLIAMTSIAAISGSRWLIVHARQIARQGRER